MFGELGLEKSVIQSEYKSVAADERKNFQSSKATLNVAVEQIIESTTEDSDLSSATDPGTRPSSLFHADLGLKLLKLFDYEGA